MCEKNCSCREKLKHRPEDCPEEQTQECSKSEESSSCRCEREKP